MKYEIKLRWTGSDGQTVAKWFPTEATDLEAAKELALQEHALDCPGAEVMNSTVVND